MINQFENINAIMEKKTLHIIFIAPINSSQKEVSNDKQ